MSEVSCEAGFGLNAHCGSSGSSAPSDSSYQGCAAETLSAQNDIKKRRGTGRLHGLVRICRAYGRTKCNQEQVEDFMVHRAHRQVFPQGESNHCIVHYSLVSIPHTVGKME